MRVSSVELFNVQIPLKARFQHARRERRSSSAVIVVLRSRDGQSGFGEIQPRDYVTGETIDEVFGKTGPEAARRVLAIDIRSREEAIEWCRAEHPQADDHLAMATGFELAMLDLAGRTFGFPLGELLGCDPLPELPQGVIIGFETATEDLRRYCSFLRLAGRKHIKVKVGGTEDRKRVEIIAGVFGDTPLRLDANGVWSHAEAVGVLKQLAGLPIASIEEPVGKGDIDGLARVRLETGIPVMADESVCSLADAERLIDAGVVDSFNIRIGKHGGVLAAAQIVELVTAAGRSCNLGTMVGETAILSRASELFGRFVPGFDCLDGRGQNGFLLENDLVDDPATAQAGDLCYPGLGLDVSRERLRQFSLAHAHFE